MPTRSPILITRPIQNRNRKLNISTAPTKTRSREPAYSQALIQNKIDRQRVRYRESGRQEESQSDGYGGWCNLLVFGVETGREVGRRGQMRIGFVEEQCFEFEVKELWRDSKG